MIINIMCNTASETKDEEEYHLPEHRILKRSIMMDVDFQIGARIPGHFGFRAIVWRKACCIKFF
jgi:hypothetical protein